MGFDFQFYLLDIDSDTDNIRIFGFTKERRRVILIDKNFHPYFYIVPNSDAIVLAENIKSFSTVDDKGNNIAVNFWGINMDTPSAVIFFFIPLTITSEITN